jgi:hypothetical protein
MSWPELHHTLTALVESISPPEDSDLRVDRADLLVPLEVTTVTGPDGPTVLARVPHSRWVAGFLPPVSMSRLSVRRVPEGVADVG